MKFTAKQARELSDAYVTPLGRVIDTIRAAASSGESAAIINNLNLSESDEKELINAGYSISGNVISF